MQLGQRIRQARLEAGLSQRQLCGNAITRNMLSQIENGSAKPSMDTLTYLAAQLQKPIGYFLEETAVLSANSQVMQDARAAYRQGQMEKLVDILKEYRSPDEVFDEEYGLLRCLGLLHQAEQAVAENRAAHARQLLEEAEKIETCYYTKELVYRRQLLMAQVALEPVQLPADDKPLLVRAKAALKSEDIGRCVALLEACEEQNIPDWHYLRAEAAFLAEDYRTASDHYHRVEELRPRDCYPKLEQCYRALEDYRRAYEYACKQR